MTSSPSSSVFRRVAVLLSGFLAAALLSASAADAPPDLKHEGVYGFPQDQATVLCDTKDLRVSAWNDAACLYVQAVVWADGDDSLGKTDDGRDVGDSADLSFNAAADGKLTPNVDRTYNLNPWPANPGLYYEIVLSASSTTHLMNDSKGRGSIRYLPTASGEVRVDSFVIPLAEIKRQPGDEVRFAYSARSPKPVLDLNSLGVETVGYNLPRAKYHEMTLADRPASLALQAIPDGRDEKKVDLAKKSVPEVGTVPPEVAAADWLNTDQTPTLAGLKGKVVVVDFWATWCGPCVAGIPHLNDLHERHNPEGLVILSFTDQDKAWIEKYRKDNPMRYILGTGSKLGAEYGVEGIPHVFVIGRDGKLAWQGHPADKDFDRQIVTALAAPSPVTP